MKNNICFFGLLHFKTNENNNLNFNSINDNQKFMIYLKNAILLDKQLKFYGHKLILITNKKKYLNRLLKHLNYEIESKLINFKTIVPKKTHFYSCHFRVDIFRYLSTLKNVYSVLLDLDVLVLSNPEKILYYQKKNISLVNNISQNVIPAYGRTKILKKLKTLNPNISKVVWYGGDFFAGNSYFYSLLYKKTKFYQKKFIENIKDLYDQTDELFMSASLHDLTNNKSVKIRFGNNLNVFNRYWNTNVFHFQKKIDFYKRFIFLHLPADKIFLSKCYDNLKQNQSYKEEYFDYVKDIKNVFRIKMAKYLPNKIKEKIKKILYN
jgi:hypothetical protein